MRILTVFAIIPFLFARGVAEEVPQRTLVCGGPPDIIENEHLESFGWGYKVSSFVRSFEGAHSELGIENPVNVFVTSNLGGGCTPAWVERPKRRVGNKYVHFPEYETDYEMSVYVSIEALKFSGFLLQDIAKHEVCHISRNHMRLPDIAGVDYSWTELDAEQCVLELIGKDRYLEYRERAHRQFLPSKVSKRKLRKLVTDDYKLVLEFKREP